MMIATLTLFALALSADRPQDCPMHAQHAASSTPVAATPAAPSPYSGEESRSIKALSEADVKAYHEGTGMGMAKPAELNQYPGPRHVLENAEALKLNDVQQGAIEASFREMKTEAVALGQQIVEAEKRLDALFAERKASEASVSQLTRQIADLSGQLRAVHLRAHLAVREQLTPEQIEQYVTLRGYTHAGHEAHEGH